MKRARRGGLFTAALVTQAGTGVPFSTGCVAIAASIVISLVAQPVFSPGLADPLNFSLTTVAYLAPLAAGAAAVHARSLTVRHVDLVSASTPRGRGGALYLGWIVTSLWQMAALLAGIALVLLQSDLSGAKTWAMALLPVQAIAVVILATTLGMLVGASVPWRGAAPALALATFGALYACSYLQGRAAVASLIFPAVYYQPFLEPNPGLLLWQSAAMGCLTLIGLATLRATRPSWTAVGAVTAAVGVAVSLSALVVNNPQPVRYRGAPATPYCTEEGGIQLCLWPESSRSAVPMMHALQVVREAASPVLALPSSYAQIALTVPGSQASLAVPDLGAPPRAYIFLAIRAAVPPLRCSNPSVDKAQFELLQWLEGRVEGPDQLPDYIQGVLKLPDRDQNAWTQSRVELVRACRE